MLNVRCFGFCLLALLPVLALPAFAQTGPDATPEIVAQAAAAGMAVPPGKFQPTWDSLRTNYSVPAWFRDAKFGIFMHWGIYAVPAHASEWYEKHMYGNPEITKWHTEKFGPPDKFGYKDFIPGFTCDKWDPDAWAALFKKAGAKIVIPTAEHHDGYALWDSAVNPWNAKKLGPHRDLIGDLGKAVRKQGLKYGVSNHGIEHFTFIRPTRDLATDLDDPQWKDFYSVTDRSDAACEKFLESWVAQNEELIDRYQPDILWFDNGVNGRVFDPIKLKVAAYYYNRAAKWGRAVSLSTKGNGAAAGPAYLAGSIMDFERSSRMPKELTDFVWLVDEPVLHRFGYTENSPIASADGCVRLLVDATSKNGALLLNISPKADGTIPDDQQKLLLQIGAWLDVNGKAIYGTRPWTKFGEGGNRGIRFTTKGNTLYALSLSWPTNEAVITSLTTTNALAGKIKKVELLGHKGKLEFSQDETGLKIKLPAEKPCDYAYVFKIIGLKLK
jgi:alpha-L-fucosidase